MFEEQNFKEYNGTDFLIYNFIKQNSEKVPYMRIRELADEVNVSTTTIIRFCKKNKFSGFSEMKSYLKYQKPEVSQTSIHNDISLIRHYFMNMDENLLEQQIKDICKEIQASESLIFLGIGTSGAVCKYAARYFSALGIYAQYIDDPFYPKKYIGSKKGQTSVFVISESGETKEVIEIVAGFDRETTNFISITNGSSNTIARISDYNLNYFVQVEKAGNHDITTSLPVLFFIELIGKELNNRLI